MAKRKKGILLGAVADDMTGATDLCNTLVASGMRTVQIIDVPKTGMAVPDADAVVVALKSRNTQAIRAVRKSLKAMDWLKSAGAKQYFFKYCSTFDSTPSGNIGPVADAMLERAKGGITIACPAFPTNGRTIFRGHLFVGDELLSDSGMRNHPLNPMTDSNLVRVLGRQTAHKVGLVPRETIAAGPDAVVEAFESLKSSGHRHAIVDAVDDSDLMTIGAACANLRLITGGSGVALGLPENFRRANKLAAAQPPALPRIDGSPAVLAGSCSVRTLEQVAEMKKAHPAFNLDANAIAAGRDVVAEALNWAAGHIGETPFLIYSSADPENVKAVQSALGREESGAMIEQAMGEIAVGLVERGVGKLVVAGGETSGAVVQALGVQALRIGPEIEPGVPWTESMTGQPLALALKSGNFGGISFFADALDMLEQ